MSVTLTGEARARLDKHLDAVEAALVAAGNSREQRRGVMDDLEAQILDMLAARSKAPTAEDVEAVLAHVDPPSAYIAPAVAEMPPPVAPSKPVLRPRYSSTAIWGLVCIIVSLALPLIMFTFLLFWSSGWHSSTSMHTRPPTEVLIPVQPIKGQPIATAPASPEDMIADRKTYAEFMSLLNAKQLTSIGVSSDGTTITLQAKCPSNRPGTDIYTTIAANTMDAESWRRLRAAAHDSGTQYTVTASGAPVAASSEPASASGIAPGAPPVEHGVIGGLPCFACFVLPLGLLGTVLGWVAFFQIRNSRGALRGKGLALFDGLFYPCVIILGLLLVVLFAPHMTPTTIRRIR